MTALQLVDRQSMLDKVWQHFVVEKAHKGVDDKDSECYHYESPNGEVRCCAIGLFDTDKKLVGDLAYARLSVIIDLHNDAFNGVFDIGLPEAEDEEFLLKLQRTHDWAGRYSSREVPGLPFHQSIEKNLRELAGTYDLSIAT